MAFSRTGWVSFPLAMLVTAWAVARSWDVAWAEVGKRLGAAFGTLLLLIGLVWAVDPPGEGGDLDLQFAFRASQGWDLLATITGWFESSDAFEDRFVPSEERADVWPEYWELFIDNPVAGAGLGVGWQTTSIGQEPHSLFLELAAELGLLGLAGFGFVLWTIWRSGAGVVGGVALSAAFLHSITQTVLFEPTWWFAAALWLAGAGGPQLVDTPGRRQAL